MRLRTLDWIALILVIIGGLNWGAVGLLKYDVVAHLFTHMSVVARAVYVLVGLAALYLIFASTRFRLR